MFKKSNVGSAVLLALGGALLPSVAVLAQETQRIEVTGSLIKRISSESASQVVTLRVDDLQKAGVTNAEQAVKFITQQQGGTVTSSSVSGTNGAAAYANLRSLGENRTLVLLNGKRIAPNPFAVVGTDLNTLPIAAIDRIETLPDGASSIYGTDAIAGVINFITRKDYRGGQVGVTAQVTEAGGGDVSTASLLGGIGDLSSQGWNVYAGLNLRKQNPMRGDQRMFSRSSYQPDKGFNGTSPTTFPANYSQGAAPGSPTGTPSTVPNANPTSPDCDPPGAISVPEANGTRIRCFADTQIFTNTVPKQDQNSLFLRGSLALGTDNTASLEYFRAYNRVRTRIAPSPEGGLVDAEFEPVLPRQRHHAGRPAIGHDATGVDRLAHRSAGLSRRRAGERDAASGCRGRRQRSRVRLSGQRAQLEVKGQELLPQWLPRHARPARRRERLRCGLHRCDRRLRDTLAGQWQPDVAQPIRRSNG